MSDRQVPAGASATTRRAPARLRPTPAGCCSAGALAGLVGGWLVRPVCAVGRRHRADRHLAAGARAVPGRRDPRRHRLARPGGPCTCTGHRLEPHHAVNRLVLAKACALVGALVAGGYAGYALELGRDGGRAGRPADAALRLAALAALARAALLVERACLLPRGRACRVQKSDPGRVALALVHASRTPIATRVSAVGVSGPADRGFNASPSRALRHGRRCAHRRRPRRRRSRRRRPPVTALAAVAARRPGRRRHQDHPLRAAPDPRRGQPATGPSRRRPTATSPPSAPRRTSSSPRP